MTRQRFDTSLGCGAWGTDAFGRPEFRVDTQTCPADAWHLVGSPGLLALAHVSGAITLYATAGGMVRLADHNFGCPLQGSTVELEAVAFGVDRCQWTWSDGATRVNRTLIADESAPVLHLEWTVEGLLNDRSTHVLTENFDVSPYPLLAAPLMSRRIPVPSTHRGFDRSIWRLMFLGSDLARRATDRTRSYLGGRQPLDGVVSADGRTVVWQPDDARIRPTKPRLVVGVPPTLRFTVEQLPPHGEINIDPKSLTIRSTSAGKDQMSALLALDDPLLKGVVARKLSPPRDLPAGIPEALAAEAFWHVQQLRALRVPDPFVGQPFVMQGSAYGFIHGLHGALRDEAFVVAALAPIDPDVAKHALLAMTSLARRDGTFHYAHTGYGAALSGGIHASPSDLGLFYLWALTRYVDATGDHDVCSLTVRLRGTANRQSTVGEVALGAARALDTRVGFGPHGMLRVGSGDWADPISLMVRRRRAFHRYGESTFNTAMALAILPDAAKLLDGLDTGVSHRCVQLHEFLGKSLEGAWTGRWYARGWDGRGHRIGADHLFLDAQVWALIARHGPMDRRAELVRTIGLLLDDPSPIGPTILDRPHKVRLGMLADGWDCNGGVWAALGGLTAWAYALHDPARAWQTLHKQSLNHRREAYPDIWYGQWSGPDASNSHFGDHPGETFVQPATPMTEFPVMNSNVHASALLGLQAVLAATGALGNDMR